jgi:hypothetical protein
MSRFILVSRSTGNVLCVGRRPGTCQLAIMPLASWQEPKTFNTRKAAAQYGRRWNVKRSARGNFPAELVVKGVNYIVAKTVSPLLKPDDLC